MQKLIVKFDGKRYEIRESLEPMLMLEDDYGSLDKVPDTLRGKLKYFYYLFKGCNDNFNYSFEQFIKLLPYQKGLQDQLSSFVEKKKIVKRRIYRTVSMSVILSILLWLSWVLIAG